jgi:ribose transport system permease protein
MATQSIKSDALEPDLSELREKGAKGFLTYALRLFPVYGLVFITLFLIALFSALLPNTFFTWINARLIMSNQASVALLALAAMIPMVAGKIDLSIGYGLVLWEVLAISFQTNYHIPWLLVMVILLFLGGLLGLINALLVELARIDAFIATLGTGTVIYALALWHTNGQQVIGDIPDSFLQLANGSLFDVPFPALYVLVFSILFWVVLDYLPLGRCLYAVGANPEAARLNGIPNRTYIALAFVTSGVLTAFAGVILASKLRIGQVGVGLDYLLPALVAAFLGSTTIKPGRVNVWGTIVAVIILSIGISGLQQLGGAFYVEPLFNGLCLLMAIGLAGFAGRRRVALRKKEELLQRDPKAGAASAQTQNPQ